MRLIYLQSFACCLLLAFSAPAFGQAAPPPGGDDAAASEDEEEEDIGEEDDLLLEIEKEFEQTEPTPGWEAAAEEVHTFPWVEHHGYFRFRPDLLFNGHLGTHTNAGLGETVGTSGVPAPLTENVENNDPNLPEVFRDRVGAQGDDTLAGANMRFRYTPTVHVSSELRIGLQLDIFDNLVLGSTPDFHPTRRPDAPLVAFAGSQQSPEAGLNSSRDAVRVKQVYGEWLSPLGLLRVGRQASHWGLGILANGGQDFDSDFGDFVDRALLLTRVPGADLYLTLAWDYVAAGKISDDAADYFGQPYDLSEQDDVREYVVALFDKSLSPKEKAQRHHRLNVLRKPVLEWGLYYVYRAQDLDVLVRDPDADPLHTLGYDDVSLVTRDAYAHIPDLWLRLDWAPAPGQLFHFEAEGAAIIGEIGNVLNDPSSGQTPDRKIRQWGFAAQLDWSTLENRLTFGLHGGAAKGDNAEFFGVLDQKNFFKEVVRPDGRVGQDPNATIANFKFDRGFYVDQILFREVIGAVTNAMYFKPYVQWDFFEKPEIDLGLNFAVEHARALEPEATPGNSANLGTEVDLMVFFAEEGVFRIDLTGALLFPGGAFDLYKGEYLQSQQDKESEMAFRLRGRMVWFF